MNIFFNIFKNALLFLPIRHRKLCGSGRCGSTLVGYKVQNGVVDLVSDGTDQWRFAAKCRPGDLLSVEHPQVFPAAAAPGYDDLVHLPALIQRADGCGDLPGSLKALHRYRAQQQPNGRPAAADHVADILQRRSGRSGHCYFSLRDDACSVKAVMFRTDARRLAFRPEEGIRVVVRCRATLYERDGAFQVYVNEMFPDGLGAAQLALEQLKARLEKEGLFDPAHKKPLPAYPKCIGVVTSKTGAALQDIRNVISRRWPSVRLLLCPVTVQGFEAARQIAAAIRTLDQSGKVDEIIVARGGGSREDLWVFNAEEIARAAFRCKTPLISAIGHEIDYTLLDFVADQRAPTPSAAAELAVPDREEQQRIFENIEENIHKNIQKRLALCYNGLEQYNFLLEQSAPNKILQQYSSRLQQMQQAIQAQQKARMNDKSMQLQHAAALAASLDPASRFCIFL